MHARTPVANPRLRIGLLAPPWVPIPPPQYGGIEQVVAALAGALVDRGHEVVLVAAPGSAIDGVRTVSPLASIPDVIGHPISDWRHALAGIDALSLPDSLRPGRRLIAAGRAWFVALFGRDSLIAGHQARAFLPVPIMDTLWALADRQDA